jgi:hypothetical protein
VDGFLAGVVFDASSEVNGETAGGVQCGGLGIAGEGSEGATVIDKEEGGNDSAGGTGGANGDLSADVPGGDGDGGGLSEDNGRAEFEFQGGGWRTGDGIGKQAEGFEGNDAASRANRLCLLEGGVSTIESFSRGLDLRLRLHFFAALALLFFPLPVTLRMK